MTNTAAADVISGDYEGLDQAGADLIITNLAVATDRLTASDFAELPREVQSQVLAVAFMADDIAPLADEGRALFPDEDEQAYTYRTAIWQRIHNLQKHIHTSEYDGNDPLEISKLKFAVQGAGLVFGAVVNASKEVPSIAETLNYFSGNTRAAARRASYITEMLANKSADEQ